MASCSSSSSSSAYNNTTNTNSDTINTTINTNNNNNNNSNNNTKIIYSPPPPPNSETASEISSVDSDWSDIRAIAFKLGVQNPDDLLTERFKVNRQKLENMIKADGTIEGMNGAEQFFENIMKNTSTYISWPCRLKIGAKTKKDPHVRIVGKPEDVIRAKEQILSNLVSRESHVIMKIDVSYTDHSCIIGRGGNNIKKIMTDTSTHIHFPDSNRSNPTLKSNQVSLCGSLEGVERARSLVRLTTPLLMSFELPIMEPGRPVPDHDTPYIKEIENKYNVQVIFSTRPKLHSSLIIVKGSEKEASKVQEATQLLINFTCENIASQILVNMQLEISPQHHEIVKGKNSANLLYIMEKTKTKIIFPDINDMNIKQIKKSQIIISGTIEGVYKARQQLIGNLPITLIFDYPEYMTDPSEITNISYKYGVFITFRQKHKQSAMVAVIKGVEKFIDKIYEARREILRLNTTNTIKPDIPQTYLSPIDHEIEQNYRENLSTFLANNPESPFTPLLPLTSTNTFQTLLNINSNHNNHNNFISNTNNNNLYHHHHQQQRQQDKYQLTPTGIGLMPNPKQLILPSNIVCRLPSNNNVNVNVNNNTNNNNNNHQNLINSNINNIISSSINNNNNIISNCINNNNNNSNTMNIMMNTSNKNSSCLSPRNSSNNTSGYQSFSSSTNSLEQSYLPYNINTNTNNNNNSITTTTNTTNPNNSNNNNNLPSSASKIHYSPDSTLNNDITIRGRRMSDGNLMHNLITSENNNNDYRNLRSYHTKQNLSFDYDLKRVYGYKAMERQPQGELRTPNSNWIGLGLSNTSPAPLETVDDMTWNYQSNSIQNLNNVNVNGNGNGNGSYNNNNCNQLSSPYHMGITSIIDSISINRHQRLSQHKDIHSLLTSIGLEHYIKTFVLNEIDLEVFTTLTEDNLIELGITAFGARKKILIAIHSLLAESLSAASSSNSGCQSIIATAVSAAATSTTLATGSAAAAASSSSSSTSAIICSLPSNHRQNVSPRFSGSAAPGAERRTSNKW